MSRNLPPGVTESMIPGNRPEDEEEERFWDDLHNRLEDLGLPTGFLESDEGVETIQAVRDMVWERAYNQALADAALEQQYAEWEEQDAEREGQTQYILDSEEFDATFEADDDA